MTKRNFRHMMGWIIALIVTLIVFKDGNYSNLTDRWIGYLCDIELFQIVMWSGILGFTY